MPFLVASRADLTHYDASCRNVFTTVQKPLQTRAQLCAVLWSTRRLFRPFPGSWNAFHLYWEIPEEHFNGVQLRTTSPFLPILPADGHREPPWPGPGAQRWLQRGPGAPGRAGSERRLGRPRPQLQLRAPQPPPGLAALQRQPGTAETLWFCCWFVWFSPPPWERVLFCADGLSLVLDIEPDPVRSEGGERGMERWAQSLRKARAAVPPSRQHPAPSQGNSPEPRHIPQHRLYKPTERLVLSRRNCGQGAPCPAHAAPAGSLCQAATYLLPPSESAGRSCSSLTREATSLQCLLFLPVLPSGVVAQARLSWLTYSGSAVSTSCNSPQSTVRLVKFQDNP